MPKIDDLCQGKTSKKFKRSNYRPWNYLEEIEKEKEIVVQSNFNTDITCHDNVIETTSDYVLNKNYAKIQEDKVKQKVNVATLVEKIDYIENNSEVSLDKIFSLTGHQKHIFLFIVEKCISRGLLNTGAVKLETLCEITKTSSKMLKLSIKRLIIKKLINRKHGKKGRGGFHVFDISEAVRNSFLEYKRVIGSSTIENKEIHKEITPHIVNNNYINNTTISKEFREIDCSPLQEFGFDESHIIQIYREHNQKPNLALSAEIIQNSINALAFDLKYNNAASSFKASPAVVLTAMLKKGQPYSSKTPEKVLSPREAAIQEYLLSQEQKNLKIMETETKAFELARKEWLGSLSEEELLSFNEDENVCPSNMHEKIYQISRRQQASANAKKYFDNIIWPQKLKEILDNKI